MKRKRYDPVAKSLLINRDQFSTKVVQDKKKQIKKGKVKHKNNLYDTFPFSFILINI